MYQNITTFDTLMEVLLITENFHATIYTSLIVIFSHDLIIFYHKISKISTHGTIQILKSV